MPPADRPVRASPRPRVRIVHLTGLVLDALATGDLESANAASPVPITSYAAGPHWRRVWRIRSEQVRQDPSVAGWVTGLIWDEDQRVVVGRAGYHGAPDEGGTVEIGYAVDPAQRRRGYARAALELLLRRAGDEPSVRSVRATIHPENTASLALTAQYGFVEVGEHRDEQDGLLRVYARSSSPQ